MKTYTLTETKKVSLSVIKSIRPHSDISFLIETSEANYFSGGILSNTDEGLKGTATLLPVLSVHIDETAEDEFEEILP